MSLDTLLSRGFEIHYDLGGIEREMFGFRKREKEENRSGIAQIVEHIKGNNPDMSDGEVLRIAEEIARKNEVNSSRRGFLKGVAALGVGAALGLDTKKAHAGGNYSYLPPGYWPDRIKNDKGEIDYRLIAAFENIYFKDFGELNNVYKTLLRKFGILNKEIFKTTPAEQPAYWFAIAYFNYKYQRNGIDGVVDTDNLLKKYNIKKNSAMYNWALGNREYFLTWIKKKNGTAKETENYLTKAIVKSAGLSGRDGELRKAIKELDENASILKEIQQGLSKANLVDKKIAAWSSYMLSRNYDRITKTFSFMVKENEIKTINEFCAWKVEYLCVQAFGNKWIRGPPKNPDYYV